jgi:hypothetical protein
LRRDFHVRRTAEEDPTTRSQRLELGGDGREPFPRPPFSQSVFGSGIESEPSGGGCEAKVAADGCEICRSDDQARGDGFRIGTQSGHEVEVMVELMGFSGGEWIKRHAGSGTASAHLARGALA